MRILCLHGIGTSSEIFQIQTAGIRSELKDGTIHHFDFVEGNISCPAAPGIQALSPTTTEFFAYFDSSNPGTVVQAIDDLIDYINSEGPFDGVMGFSQGAALAAMLLLQPSTSGTPLFSFAVFICAGMPLCESSARKGVEGHLDPQVDSGRITIPTAHIVGSKDENIAFSMRLAELCLDNMRVVYDHGARHEIPFQPSSVTKEMASCIEEVIVKATFLQ